MSFDMKRLFQWIVLKQILCRERNDWYNDIRCKTGLERNQISGDTVTINLQGVSGAWLVSGQSIL